MTLEPIALLHQGRERTIASDVVATDDGPALFDAISAALNHSRTR